MNATLSAPPPDARVLRAMTQRDSVDYGRMIVLVAESRDREAFAQLFAHFAPKLKAYLRRSGATASAAEDFAQEAMLTVWRKAALYDPSRAAASSWIFTIARNHRIDALRRQGYGLPQSDLSQAQDDPPMPDDLLVGQDNAARIRSALGALSDEQAKVVQLSFFHDKAHAEIARELNLPLGTVKSRLRLAMLRLRDMLSDLT
ncbi:MAG: RNA polymerase subunit sigma [Rhizobiales bacterium 32-66-8]|jgi:RNA polymerase sigma-70 factor (ECF subfamily)|nr:MAG: RNA polymerase subunit sigma [Rhizobiales bacterium 32-66-8]